MTSSSVAPPILYGVDLSPPCRAVLLTAKAINLNIDYRRLDLFNKKEHLTDWFLQKNPQHTVPVLEDQNNQILTDSHAIVAYLITKYATATNLSLYPSEPYQRALIDQRLHFDSGVLFPRLRAVSFLLFRKHDPNIPTELIDNIHEAYDFMEQFLQKNLFMCGDHVTIADFCIIATTSALQILAPIQTDKYPKLNGWVERITKLPYYYEGNGKMADEAKIFINDLVKKLKEKPAE